MIFDFYTNIRISRMQELGNGISNFADHMKAGTGQKAMEES
jgi:hypothetical protein